MPDTSSTPRAAGRGFFDADALTVAPRLLDALLVSEVGGSRVVVRITEVEAYLGVGEDPGSHAFRRKTTRNSSMFLIGGHLYVYRSYGIHWCVNVVVGPPNQAAAVLLRAGEVVEGVDVATARRRAIGTVTRPGDLARGPGRLATALGVTEAADSVDLCDAQGDFVLAPRGSHEVAGPRIGRSTRTGVSGPGAGLPYRFYLTDEPTVSLHRPVLTKKTTKTGKN